MPTSLNSQRIDQTRSDLTRLRGEISNWLAKRRKADRRQQHVTQLNTLEHQFEFVLGQIERSLGDINLAPPPWQTYADCRKADRRLLWVRRLWIYFQSKFDQRDAKDEALTNILAAADDAIWSCYAEPFFKAERTPSAMPLPYVAPFYSPSAVPRDEPPPDLRSDVDAAFVSEMLQQIPVPLVALPPNCSDEPWVLAYVAHEVGHHVQTDYLADGALIGNFAEVLKTAGGDRWARWGQEIFADVYSLLAIGPWALWALTELVWGPAAAMLDDSNSRYPSPLVRLLFMKAVADKLGLDGTSALRGMTQADFLDAGQNASASGARALADIAQIGAVACKVTGDIPGVGKLKDLLTFDPSDFGAPDGLVPLWAANLGQDKPMVQRNGQRDARLVLAGGVEAWATATAGNDAERKRVRERLKTVLPKGIIDNREEIVRAALEPTDVELADKSKRLAQLLLADDRAQRGA